MLTLTCLGAARTVTGSKHLLDTGRVQVLVDCGLFQGLKELRERNWQPLPVPAQSIDAVVLTHAHLDHCGYLPRLVAQGFRGRVFCTAGTADLARIVLADAAKLQEEDAERANRKGYTRHRPALPLYTSEDANRALLLLQPVGYDRPMPVAPGIEAEFINAGHLLGSSLRARAAGGHRAGRSCSAATWAGTAARCCRIPGRRPRRTSSWSNRRTAIGCTTPTTRARGSRR